MSKVDLQNELLNILNDINQKMDKKTALDYLESDVVQITKTSISNAIEKVLEGYNSPLAKVINQVFTEHYDELKNIVTNSFETAIRKPEFEASIRDAFSHKVARTLISNNDGLFEKVSNDLKQDTIFKAKLSIAVSNVINECLSERALKNNK